MKPAHADGRRAGTKMQAVRDWFSDPTNAGEYLTYADMRDRFDISAKHAKGIAYTLRASGLIDSAVMLFKVPGA